MESWVQFGIFALGELLLGGAIVATIRADLKNVTGWVKGLDSIIQHHETRISRVEGRLSLDALPMPKEQPR